MTQLDLYREQPDESLLSQSQRVIDYLTKNDGLMITGTCGMTERFRNNQETRGDVGESCATAYLIRMNHNRFQLKGETLDSDIMERAIYNALFAAQSPDGRRLRYFSPLEGNRVYFGPDSYCCPNNFRRIIAELPGMICYQSAGGVAVNLYAQSTAKVDLGEGRSVTVQQDTDYPTSGVVKIVVTPSEPMEFPLKLRLPRWCPKLTLAIHGEKPIEVSPGNDFYEVRRVWKPGDSVTLDMPMPWRLVRGRKSQEGRVALMRGPVVYCIGTAQNAELIKKYPKPGDLVLDPASLGAPVSDTMTRPDGQKVLAKAWPPEGDLKTPATLDVVLTEFADPNGIATYFRIPDLTKAVDDELIAEK
jgi:DUF1680 family protein